MELLGRSVDTCGLDLFQRLRKGEEKRPAVLPTGLSL
jgi:hypothetical protein